jgi:C4-dicarboxylate-specific signal transduction histidine kinase
MSFSRTPNAGSTRGPALLALIVAGAGVGALMLMPARQDAATSAYRAWLPGMLLLSLGIAVWTIASRDLNRRAAAIARDGAALQDLADRRAGEQVDRFFIGLPAAVYRGELYSDGSLLFSFISEGIARLTGRETGHFVESGWWRSQLETESRSSLDLFYRRLLDEGEATTEYVLAGAAGGRIWLRDTARVAGSGAGDSATVAGVLTDVTRERQLAERAAMASKLETLGKMTTSIAHELTQPLGTIKIASENALAALEDDGGNISAPTLARIGRINEQADRARKLIEQLRSFGRAETGQLAAVDVRAALNGAMTLACPVLHTASVEYSMRVPDDLPAVKAQLVLFEQVMVNLFVNARDALAVLPEEARRLEIVAAHDADTRMVRLSVEDSGPGFPGDLAQRVFEPFFTTKPVGQGTGLGLAICREIVEGFGGRISARNGAMGGCVTLELPVWNETAAGAAA